MRHASLLSSFAAIAAITPALPGQRLVREMLGPAGQTDFGFHLARCPDANADGRADLVVGAPAADAGATLDTGAAFLVSTADGATLLTRIGTVAAARLGSRVLGPGDLNGDGTPDLVCAGPLANNQAGLVQAIASTGAVLWTRNGWAGGRMGSALASIRDISSDNCRDIMISAPAAVSGVNGYVGSFASSNGFPLTLVNGSSAGSWGSAMVTLGDIDGDGDEEVAASEPLYAGGVGRISCVRPIVNGAPSVLWTTGAAFLANENVGYVMGDAGDLTGDGKRDLLASTALGRVYLLDGATGATLGFVAHPVYANATALAGIGDQNGDGVPEFAIGQAAYNNQAGRVAVHDGASRALLYLLDGTPGSLFGSSIVSLGDIDGDGVDDFAVGAPRHAVAGVAVGRVAIHGRSVASTLTQYGVACGGTSGPLQLTATGTPSPGQTFTLHAANLGPGPLGLWLWGASRTTSAFGPLPLDLAVLGMTGCSLLQSLDVSFAFVPSGGQAAFPVAVPGDYALVGLRLHGQTLMLDPTAAAGMTTSNGVEAQLGNQ